MSARKDAKIPGPQRDADDEKAFLENPAAPVSETHDYRFSIKRDVMLTTKGGVSIKVLQARPTGIFARKSGPATAKEIPIHYYRGKSLKKDLICLHFTAGGFRGSLGSLVLDGRQSGVPYLIGRSGTIYELHDDELWGNSSSTGRNDELVAIELVNVGPLKKGIDGYYGLVGNKFYCGLDREDLIDRIPGGYNGYEHFATFTDEQYDSLASLLRYLSDKYAIPLRFLPANPVRDPKAQRYLQANPKAEVWKDFRSFRGVVSHVNFKQNGKWDIGPAFDWERLTASRLALPVDVGAVGGSAPKGDELRVTRENLDCFFAHTEKDTANKGGSYPVGINTQWHGGVHLFVDGADLHASFDGQIVAARLATPTEGLDLPDHYGSSAFLLVRHELDGELVRQLDRLLVPQTHAITERGAKLDPSKPFPDAKFELEPGDEFERTDDEDARLPTSEPGKRYPVRIKQLADVVELVGGFEVTAVAGKKAGREPKLVFEQAGRREEIALEPKDRLRLAPGVPAHADLRRRELVPGETYEVQIESLPGFASVSRYEVRADWHLGFRKAKGTSAPDDASATKDDGRHPDLCKGDILKVLHGESDDDQDDDDFPGDTGGDEGEGGGAQKNEVEVEVVTLAKGSKDPASIALTQGMPLLANAKGELLFNLVTKDVVTLVQRAARGNKKSCLDLVKLAKLAPEPHVPDEDAEGTVKAKSLALHDAPRGKKRVATLERSSPITVTDARQFPWLKISGEGGEGWVAFDKSKLDLPLIPRDHAKWAQKLIGKTGFVKAFSNAELAKAESSVPRALTVGTRGFIDVSSSEVEAVDGVKRETKYADKLRLTAKLKYDPALLQPTAGKMRPDMYGSMKGAEGQLTFDPHAVAENRVLRRSMERLIGKPFYALYMHLDDQLVHDQAKLDRFRWLPREVRALTLKQRTTWQPDGGEHVPLIPGDKLRLEKPWRTDESPREDQRVSWETIAKEDFITVIRAKASKKPVWLLGSDRKTKLHPLSPDDLVRPKVPASSYAKNTPVEVAVVRHATELRAIEGPKKWVALTDDGGHRVGPPVPSGTVVTVLGVHGARSFVQVGGSSTRGWMPTKDLGRAVPGKGAMVPNTGFILWRDDAFEPAETKDRSAVYAEHRGKLGRVDLHTILGPDFADKEEGPSTEITKRLAQGEVVCFPLAARGASPSTRVRAGDLLYVSGTFAPVLPRDEPRGAHGKLIHWEIFSEENLIPARPFRKDDTEWWKRMGWPWWEVADTNGDWTMDCKEVLALVASGVPESEEEQEREKLVGEILNPKEVESLYREPVASQLRRLASQFVLEWAVDVREALRKTKDAPIDHDWWGQLKQRFAGGAAPDWSDHVNAGWIERQARYFAPLLWWKEAWASANRDLAPGTCGLPGRPLVWHYNPIAFLEAFGTTELAKRDAAASKAKASAPAGAAQPKKQAPKEPRHR